ncbi:MAG: hypothetical protein O7C98_02960 [Planctomycetota bacterium]|nr:hypothetical protein [Planctomycetota bacterium]
MREPPDPVERGSCALLLRALDGAKYRSLEISIQLWRLNAPGNREWTQGDQLQTRVELLREGTRIERLPAGEYRVYSPYQRAGTDDPISFRVDGAETTHTLVVPMPRKHKVSLEVYDEEGRLLDWKEYTRYGRRRSWSGRRGPSWIEQRRRKQPVRWVRGSGGGMSVLCAHAGKRIGPPRAEPQPILVGEYPEDDKRGRTRSAAVYRFDGDRNEVRLTHYHASGGDRTYVGLSVAIGPIRDAILLPDGRKAVDAGAELKAACAAVQRTEATAPDIWRTLPIRVTVNLKGHEELEFEHRLGRKLTPRVLKPKTG